MSATTKEYRAAWLKTPAGIAYTQRNAEKRKASRDAKAAYDGEYRARNRDSLKAKKKSYYEANKPTILAAEKLKRQAPGYLRNKQLKTLYGISLADYNALLESQGGVCGLCGSPFAGSGRDRLAPCVDHDHSTGRVRGVIHNICNRLLVAGLECVADMCGRSPHEVGAAALAYIDSPPASEVAA